MSLVKCLECGDVFIRTRYDMCPKCRARESEHIDLLKRYLDDNPDADLAELERISGLKRGKILKFVREGKLISVETSGALVIHCEECGTVISVGRFCRRCAEKLKDRLSRTANDLKKGRSE